MAVDARVEQFCVNVRQGDLLAAASISIAEREEPTPNGVVVISQTCDIVQTDGRPNLVVAKAVELGESDARDALKGRRPRFVHIPGAPGELFADLEYIASMEKTSAVNLPHTRCIDDDAFEHQRKVAIAIGRRFSRLALPEEVIPWFDGLKKQVSDKANNPDSPLGRVLDVVREIRVQAKHWRPPGIDLKIYIIVAAGELPMVGDEPFPAPDLTLATWLDAGRGPAELAEALFPTDGNRPSGAHRDHLWRALAVSFAGLIKPPARFNTDESVQQAIAGVVVEVVGEDEFTFLLHRRSDEIDLAHLSGPTPDTDDSAPEGQLETLTARTTS